MRPDELLTGGLNLPSLIPGFMNARPRRCILVVEDFRPLLNGMLSVLESSHFHVLAAASGEAALLLSKNHASSIELVITRLLLPDMNGLQLTAKIRVLVPDVPVLYTSEDSPKIASDIILQEVCESLLPDPFTDEVLLRRVESALKLGN